MADRLFENKVALVTGAALGMGRATARRFAAEGAKVCVVDIDQAGAEDTVRVIRDAGGEAFAFQADISEEAGNQRMVDETVRRYGGIDAANLNAAILGDVGGFFESSLENFDRVIRINLRGCYLGLKALGEAVRPEGAIVAMSSAAGLKGWAGNAAYSAAKHGVIGLVKSAAEAFGPKRVRVNLICPGTTKTRMFIDNPGEDPIVAPSDLKMPDFGGVATAQHISELVLYLASSRASFINGAVHLIDGGANAAYPAS